MGVLRTLSVGPSRKTLCSSAYLLALTWQQSHCTHGRLKIMSVWITEQYQRDSQSHGSQKSLTWRSLKHPSSVFKWRGKKKICKTLVNVSWNGMKVTSGNEALQVEMVLRSGSKSSTATASICSSPSGPRDEPGRRVSGNKTGQNLNVVSTCGWTK